MAKNPLEVLLDLPEDPTPRGVEWATLTSVDLFEFLVFLVVDNSSTIIPVDPLNCLVPFNLLSTGDRVLIVREGKSLYILGKAGGASPSIPFKATQAEVDSGVIGTKYVTPYELKRREVDGCLREIYQQDTSAAESQMVFASPTGWAYDTGGYVDPVDNTLKAPRTGLYQVGWRASTSGITAVTMKLYVNNADTMVYRTSSSGVSGAATDHAFSQPIKLNADDRLHLTREAPSTLANWSGFFTLEYKGSI